MTKNFAYEVVCLDNKGWGSYNPEDLWGPPLVERADRIFATALDAHICADTLRDAGCWEGQTPTFGVKKISVYEALWMDNDDDERLIEALTDIHGGDIDEQKMPRHVAKFLIAKFSEHSEAWARASANMRGASSAWVMAGISASVISARLEALEAKR